jgi:DNA-binding CsgD family transcriptional regulator
MSARGDAETAIRLAAEATAIGRELGVADLEAVGLAQEGVALVIRGHVEDGMRRLDEASAIAAHEDLELPISLGWALCYLITACEGVGDFPRAAQWCEITRTFAERWGARQLIGICRSAYGRVLATGGDWVAAEAELTAAVGDLAQSRPGMAGGGLVRLGELRVRQGRPAEARELFERAGAHPMALLGLGDMALDAGDAAAAAHAAERILRRLPEGSVLHQVPALELLVRARSATGEYETAAAACAELDAAGAQLGTPYVLGRARLAAGELAAAQGEHDEARRACEDAIDRFSESSAPYDGARARLALARALAALGHRDAAAAEARAARETFASLGAARDVERADAALAPVATAEAAALGDLTARELDVLRLVAQGLSDAEIAARLFLSPHTVHRHVANTRAKLRLPSRAAAVAYASRAGLL